ncbi:MAG: hypothetical protein KKA31_01650 [Candidatus Margulisbacteria bacterium]|nr:hypothetical protein [Candidatus Margulisiibacteriota bacterium]
MYDLLYCSGEPQKELKEKFPDAVFEDASDFVHEHRFSIRTETKTEDYRRTILKLGLADISLNFQMWLREKPGEVKVMLDNLKKDSPCPKQ